MDFSDYAPPAKGKQAALFRSFLAYVRLRGLFRPGETVVLGVSGGADSTALALMLSRLRDPELFALSLRLAHFNHQLRTVEEADADERFVRGLAELLHIPISSGVGDVRAFARRRHLPLEDAARRLRYRFLGEEAARLGASAVAVGHTLNDQAETLLLHVIRGAGLRGLRAMTPRAAWPFGSGPDLVRPLLNLRRVEAEFYCRESGLVPCVDATNLLADATRNRVRHNVLPAMRDINPKVDEALARLARSVESDLDYLEREAEAVWNTLIEPRDEGIRFPRVQISELHPALASRLLARAAKTAGGPDAVPSYEQVEKALAMARSPRQRWSMGFPAGVTVAGRNRVLRVGLIPADRGRLRAVQLPVPGTLDFDGWRITARSGTRSPAEPGDQVLLLDAAVIRGNLTVRSRRDGDRMRPLGLGGTKKVQDILVDRKVPVETRDQLPLVCDDAGVLWIPEQCIDERATVRSEAAAIIQLTARRLIGSGGAATIKTRARGSRARKG